MPELRLNDPDRDRSVVVEDDGRTGYAYLLESEEIVSDVWLYNCDAAGPPPNWDDPADLPFPNRAEFIVRDALRRDQLGEIKVRWDALGGDLHVRGVVIARVERGAKPGWSRNAAISGPLARPLSELDLREWTSLRK